MAFAALGAWAAFALFRGADVPAEELEWAPVVALSRARLLGQRHGRQRDDAEALENLVALQGEVGVSRIARCGHRAQRQRVKGAQTRFHAASCTHG